MASLAAFTPVAIGARSGRVARRAQRGVTRACAETPEPEAATPPPAPETPKALFGKQAHKIVEPPPSLTLRLESLPRDTSLPFDNRGHNEITNRDVRLVLF